jgi:CDGSH-type Zn-finger protein
MPEPNIPKKAPYVLQVEPGEYAWCACGRSDDQPYCDGSHVDAEFEPLVVTITEKKTVAWCGCKHSGKKPYCDGTHKKL